jgi:hypothetical protein
MQNAPICIIYADASPTSPTLHRALSSIAIERSHDAWGEGEYRLGDQRVSVTTNSDANPRFRPDIIAPEDEFLYFETRLELDDSADPAQWQQLAKLVRALFDAGIRAIVASQFEDEIAALAGLTPYRRERPDPQEA